MTLTIKIDMNNAAFEGENWAFEAAKIVRDLAKHIESGDDGRNLMDSNGNQVGKYYVIGLEDHLQETTA